MGEEEKEEAGTGLRSTAALIRTLMGLLYGTYALRSQSCGCTTTLICTLSLAWLFVFSAYTSPVWASSNPPWSSDPTPGNPKPGNPREDSVTLHANLLLTCYILCAKRHARSASPGFTNSTRHEAGSVAPNRYIDALS